MARQAASNQLGILEYCQSQGDTDASAVAAQKTVMSKLPPAPNGDSLAEAEALGKQGTLSANGTNMSLKSIADGHNTTVAALCKQMATTVVQVAKSFSAGGMPAMPGNGMPSMPNMPSGSMPSMPNMPAMPGTPSTPTAPAKIP